MLIIRSSQDECLAVFPFHQIKSYLPRWTIPSFCHEPLVATVVSEWVQVVCSDSTPSILCFLQEMYSGSLPVQRRPLLAISGSQL